MCSSRHMHHNTRCNMHANRSIPVIRKTAEYFIGLQDGVSFAYNIGTDDIDTAIATDAFSTDYAAGFIVGFESISVMEFHTLA